MPETWLALDTQTALLPKDLSFSAITEDDTVFLNELYRSTRWQEVQQAPWSDQQRIDFLTQQFNAQHQHYTSHYPHAEKLIIKQQDQPIGRIYLDRDDVSICLIDVSLVTAARGQGIGTKLLKMLLNEAQLSNKKIVLHVENFNPAYHWYCKHGFQQIEDKGVYQYMEWLPTQNQ